MRRKSTLLLFAAVAIAAVVAYSLSKKPTLEEIQQQRRRVLAGFDSGDIQALTIQEGEKRIVCRRLEGDREGWRIAEPIQVRADRWEVESILDRLELAEKVSAVYPQRDQPLDLAAYGLEPPAREVIMSQEAGGRTWTILVGKQAGVADAIYIALEGEDGVYAIRKDVVDKTDVTVTDLRSKKLAPRISSLDLEKITVSAAEADGEPAFEAQCEKSAEKWELKEPFFDLADREKVETLASKLYDHRIGTDDFIVDDPTKAAEYGLDKPALTLTLEGGEKTQTVILARSQEGDKTVCYAMHRGEPAIVRVPESLLSDLRKSPADLRDRSLVSVLVYDVDEVALAGPVGELVLTKDDDAWQIAGEQPVAADKDVTDRFIRDLKGARVEEFIAGLPEDLSRYGLSNDRKATVTLRTKAGRALVEACFGSADPTGEFVYAMRPPYPSVLSLKKDSYLDSIAAGRLAFLDRLVLAEPTSNAVEVSLERGAARFQCAWDDGEEYWKLVKPIQGKADQRAVSAIVGDFAQLRAEAFAAEQPEDLSPFGLEKPEFTVSVTYQPKEAKAEEEGGPADTPERRVFTLEVGSPTQAPARGRYARLTGDERVFVVADYTTRHFTADLASKLIYRSADLVGLKFQRNDEARRFTYDPEKKAWKDAKGNELEGQTADAARGVVALLREFTALKVADYTEKSPALYGFDKPYVVVELEEKTAKGKRIVVGAEVEEGNRYIKGPATGFVLVAARADVEKLLAVVQPPSSPPPRSGTPDTAREAVDFSGPDS